MEKWLALLGAVFVICMAVALGFTEYTLHQCRSIMVEKNYSAEDIIRTCR